MESLSYDIIIPRFNSRFPEFIKNDPDLVDLTEGLPGVHLGFFIHYAAENWSNETLQIDLANFINSLSESSDEGAKITFSDFALDFQLHFRNHGMNCDSFLTLLNEKTRLDFRGALDFWDEANQRIRADGS